MIIIRQFYYDASTTHGGAWRMFHTVLNNRCSWWGDMRCSYLNAPTLEGSFIDTHTKGDRLYAA